MKTLAIISLILALIAVIFALLAFIANYITINYVHENEEETKRRMDNLSEAIHFHAIDKDLHKTSKTKEK